MDQEEVALRFQKYALISAAVVDESGRLVGQITVDDVVHIIQEEAGEDVLLLSGAGEGDINEPIRDSYISRVRWLVANLVTALLGATIISSFGGAIEKLVALAALMPIVAGIGGNTGNQTITMIVRGLALHHVQLGNLKFLMFRELGVALINGLVWGGLMGVVTWLLYSDWEMGAVMTLAMVLNLLMAALMGVLIPMTMVRFGRDPAVGSSVMITAACRALRAVRLLT